MERRKRGGRPGREPVEGERVKLGLRVTAELKRRLDAAAEASGRSQSQEAEYRLERSFERNDLLIDALILRYGRTHAGILLVLASMMQTVGTSHLAISRRASLKPPFLHAGTWTDDHASLEMGLIAGIACLAEFWLQQSPESVTASDRRKAVGTMAHVLAVVLDGGFPEFNPTVRAEIETIRALLGPDILSQIKAQSATDAREAMRALFTMTNKNWSEALALLTGQPRKDPKS
jgi:TraY domain